MFNAYNRLFCQNVFFTLSAAHRRHNQNETHASKKRKDQVSKNENLLLNICWNKKPYFGIEKI